MKISFVLAGEGSSDQRLVDHIETVLIEEGFSEVSGDAPDLSMFKRPVGRTVREKLMTLVKLYPNVDVIFIHRDADRVGIDVREQEITIAADGVCDRGRIIPVIPIAMLETWLLADLELIKQVAGNAKYKGEVNGLPSPNKLEDVVDSKQLLQDVLCEVSQVTGERLKKFKRRFPEMRARLTFGLDPNGPVLQLNSYRCFREGVRNYFNFRLGVAGN